MCEYLGLVTHKSSKVLILTAVQWWFSFSYQLFNSTHQYIPAA